MFNFFETREQKFNRIAEATFGTQSVATEADIKASVYPTTEQLLNRTMNTPKWVLELPIKKG